MKDIIDGLHRVHETRLLLQAVAGQTTMPEDQIPEDATSLLYATRISMCAGRHCLLTTVELANDRPLVLKDGLGLPVNVSGSRVPTIAVQMCAEHQVNRQIVHN